MHIQRTRFKKDIVSEFLPPLYSSKKQKIIIFCSGLPTSPSHREILEFFSKKGFWIFFPRYRGTWESGGNFLKHSPHKDILDVINGLRKKFTSLWEGKHYKLKPGSVFLIGNSFGGPAAILASAHPLVKKVVLLAPVIDWAEVNKTKPRDSKYAFLKLAYGQAYRGTKKDWDKLKGGKFYNPIREVKKIDGKKLLIFHSKDDDLVPYESSLNFSKLTGACLVTLKKAGHLSSRAVVRANYYKKISKFFQK